MRLIRFALWTALASSALAGGAVAQDSMGGFDQPYTNGGNMFGHGAWGNGGGTYLPVPSEGPSYGFLYGQPYGRGSNTFGTGFWVSEYFVRSGGGQGRSYGDAGDDFGKHDKDRRGKRDRDHRGKWDKDDHGKWDGKDGHGGKGKPDHGKPDKPHKPEKPHKPHKPHKPDHGKPHKPKPPKVIYVPYPRVEKVVVSRRARSIVIIERPAQSSLGRIELTEAPRVRVESFAAICIDGKGNDSDAIQATNRMEDPDYRGEVFRCAGNGMLRVGYPTGAYEIEGEVATSNGTSYFDCAPGQALLRDDYGDLVCARKSPMSAAAERRLADAYAVAEEDYDSSYYQDDYAEGEYIGDAGFVPEDQGAPDDGYGRRTARVGQPIQIDEMELTGGVGTGGGY